MNQYTAEQVEKHTERGDIWMTIHGKVYDISKFLEDHPGGEEVLLDLAGKDATQEFEEIGHSEDSRELLVNMLVGELKGSADGSKKADDKKKEPEAKKVTKQDSSPSVLVFVIPVLVAVGLAYYYKFHSA